MMATGLRPKMGLALQNIALPGPIGGFAGGTWNLDGTQATPVQQHAFAQDADAPQKGGFFKEGGMGRMIAGLIGDALLQNADMAPVYSPMMRQRQAVAAEEAQWSRRRQAEREDKQWEWANKPRDVDPYRWRGNDGSLMEIGADGQPRVVYKDPTEKTSFITADNGDGTKTIIPVVNGVPQMGKPQASAPKRNLGPVVDTIPGGPPARPAGPFR